ncbi:GIY-YIG nuclease family protein [Kangiella koreensis]|uniref:Excinuclease ABC C subunit domain protein n=1 Tax=Kangiella koreensis (strain DSM 16069 / JCM 12317 / KCTC 12182 / SW-125) TaxID=523791 RepID=C7R7T3_KANKD|nr:GIY-YIG nuclease family protein [Kangiella koreensis]ACV27616.1 Excinuclease ABC C subunit domain protein [Kangiella koreensis DSM 16069]
MENNYYVYIMTTKRNGALYVGVTSDLIKRVWQHKNNVVESFTQKYRVHQLVYYEQCDSIETALNREKRLKEWKRQWKVDLIESKNPYWNDLYPKIT